MPPTDCFTVRLLGGWQILKVNFKNSLGDERVSKATSGFPCIPECERVLEFVGIRLLVN